MAHNAVASSAAERSGSRLWKYGMRMKLRLFSLQTRSRSPTLRMLKFFWWLDTCGRACEPFVAPPPCCGRPHRAPLAAAQRSNQTILLIVVFYWLQSEAVLPISLTRLTSLPLLSHRVNFVSAGMRGGWKWRRPGQSSD